MILLHPQRRDRTYADDRSDEVMRLTIAFFETKGKRRLKDDDHGAVLVGLPERGQVGVESEEPVQRHGVLLRDADEGARVVVRVVLHRNDHVESVRAATQEHDHQGVDLDPGYAKLVLTNLFTIWKRPVTLLTKEKDKPIAGTFDGSEFTEEDVKS